MSVANPNLVPPLRNISYTVQLAPYLVETICELARSTRDKAPGHSETSGLLFGSAENGLTIVDALKTFKESGPRSDLARRERLDKAVESVVAEAAEDPELSSLKMVGWFSMRSGSGLLTSDVDFHNRHFKSQEDLALVIWRETDTQVIAELYAKAGTGGLSGDDYSWSSVRLSTEMRRVSEPIDLAMRLKVSDDSYVITPLAPENEKRDDWKKMLSFLPGRKKEEASGYAVSRHDAFASAPPMRAQEAWDPKAPFYRPEPPEPTRFLEPAMGLRNLRLSQPAEVGGLPMVIGRPPARRRILPGVSIAVVFILFCGLTFAVLAIKGLASGNGKLSQIMRVIFPGTDLGVHVDSQGEKLLVSWNRRNPAVASALDATLQIFDGAEHREVRLDPGQVADGSVLYKPVSSDVTFRLEVHGADQTTALGSVRVLDATSGAAGALENHALDLSKEVTPPAPVPVPASKAALPRRPVLYRNSENGRVSVPVPLPASPRAGEEAAVTANRDAAGSGLPGDIPTASDTTQVPVPTENNAAAQAQNQAKTASGTPAPGQTLRAGPRPANQPTNQPTTGTSGSTINGWDSTAPENLHQTPPQDQDGAADDAKTISFVGPRPLLQVMPNTKALPPGTVPQVMRVEVQVKVDATGHVSGARALNDNVRGPLSTTAVAAARQWTFQPATLRGEPVASDHTIVFEFRPEQQ